MTTFADLGLAAPILETLAAERYQSPTPIQAQAIPHILAGRDLLGIAQTGTGKTAAFALPILHRLAAISRPRRHRGARVLVLAPTRELASQIADSFRVYGRGLGLTVTVVFGGVGAGPQIRALNPGVDVLVATPGRLLDHFDQGHVRLEMSEVVVLDEVDRMLDMGFIGPVRRIVAATAHTRQTLLFSATMPRDIRKLAEELLRQPEEVAVAPASSTVDLIDQRVIHVQSRDKPSLLASIMSDRQITRALVFTRTKRGADRVTKHLAAAGVGAAAIHGNKSQSQRELALASFRSGRARVLVATDIAARGLDVDGVTHVINFELPNIPESYVHRIGRTARAGAAGTAISFCDSEERPHLRDIETLIQRRLPAQEHRGAGPVAQRQPNAKPVLSPQRALSVPIMPAPATAAGSGRKRTHPGSKPISRTPPLPALKTKVHGACAAADSNPADLSTVRFLAPPQPPHARGPAMAVSDQPTRPRRRARNGGG